MTRVSDSVDPVDSIREAFTAIGASLEPYDDHDFAHGDREKLRPILDAINELAGRDVDEESVEALAADAALTPLLRRIDQLRALFCPRLEVDQAEQIAEADDPWSVLRGFLFYPNYLELARTEVAGAGLGQGDHVVFIGSGPLPLSCITMSARHGLTCAGVERLPEAADLSRRVVRRLGLDDRITIVEGDHFSVPLPPPAPLSLPSSSSSPLSPAAGADLTMVASAAEPKAEIFHHLAAVLPPGAKVSYRIHEKGLRRLINSAGLTVTPPGFRETTRVQPRPPVINTCVFVEKT